MPNKLLNGLPVTSRVPTSSSGKSTVRKIRIRPVDGGLNVSKTGELIDVKQSPAMRDVYFFRNEMRKAHSSTQLGADLDNSVVNVSLWKKLDGIIYPVAITTRDFYYYQNAIWNKVSPAGSLSGTANNYITAAAFNDTFYFVSFDFELRSWIGPSNSHAAVAGGFSAKGMDIINNRIVLAHIIDNGVARAQTIKWTQNGSASFTGTGSGTRDLADRPDTIQNIRKLGPYRGLVYKEDRIVDMRSTGDASFPFDTTELVGGLGLLCPYSLAEWAGGHFFVSNDESIFAFDGSKFDDIGIDIRDEFFNNLNPNYYDIVIGFFNSRTSEYIVIIPVGSQSGASPSLYYAYDTRKKRWRSGIYSGLTAFSTYASSSGISWDEDIGTWDSATDTWNDLTGITTRRRTLVGTSSKRVLILDEGAPYSFDGSALQFSYQIGDIVGENDGDEITLLEVIIGYIVDGAATLLVDATIDQGNTFVGETAATLGGSGLKAGDIHYARASLIVTGDNIRIRVRNSIATETIRIVSITPNISYSQSSRSESKQ